MNEHPECDALDALRAADPVDDDRLPSASLARIRARVTEDVMSTTDRGTRARAARRARWVGVGAAALAVGLLAVVIGSGRLSPAPPAEPGSSPGMISASCVERYAPDTLPRRELAFDGEVTAIDGDRVTFRVNEAFKGVRGDSITLDAPGMTGGAITSTGGPNLARGERYLVAGDSTFVWSCGFTQPWDAGVAAEWAAAFG